MTDRPQSYGLDIERTLTDADLAQRATGDPWPGQQAALAEIARRKVEAAARTTPAAADRADAAGAQRFAVMDKPSDAEAKVAAGKQAVTDALARHPFRDAPSWQDLHTAVEAVLRFVFGTPSPADVAADGSAGVTLAGPATKLTAEQAKAEALTVTGALMGDASLVVPDRGRWKVTNATTGGARLTARTEGGTGVTIERGPGVWVYADGTNVLVDPALAGGPKEPPSGLDARQMAAWNRGWDEAPGGAPGNARTDGQNARDDGLPRTAPPLDAADTAEWLAGWDARNAEAGVKFPQGHATYAAQPDNDIVMAGQAARAAGASRNAPSALDPRQRLAWERGWDGTDRAAGASGPIPVHAIGDDQTRIVAGQQAANARNLAATGQPPGAYANNAAGTGMTPDDIARRAAANEQPIPPAPAA